MEASFANIAILVSIGIAITLIISSITVAKGDEIITLERLYFGKQMPDGKTIALSNEVGVQARVLGPGVSKFTQSKLDKITLCGNKK